MTALVKFVILTIVIIVVVVGLRTLRPKLREQRYRRWEKAGLLPHQVDPYAPRKADANDSHDNGENNVDNDNDFDNDIDDENDRR